MRVPQYQMTASGKASPQKILERIKSVEDKRFLSFQRKLMIDFAATQGRSLNIQLWIQLGCWIHAAGSFQMTALSMRELSREWFGYEIPAKIGHVLLREYRYRSMEAIAAVSPPLITFHKTHVK